MQAFLMVFLGGGLGSLCRYSIARLLSPYNLLFPWATFLANAISCVIIGMLIAWSLKNSMDNSMKLLWLTGFCGGFSTFSTFTAETFQLFKTGNMGYALINIGLSLLVCLFCVWVGMSVIRA